MRNRGTTLRILLLHAVPVLPVLPALPGAVGVWLGSGSAEAPGVTLSVNDHAKLLSDAPGGAATKAAATTSDPPATELFAANTSRRSSPSKVCRGSPPRVDPRVPDAYRLFQATMPKYDRLNRYLIGSAVSSAMTVSFSQLEGILGFGLPVSARTRTAWWENESALETRHPHARAWRLAGWRAIPNLAGETVMFEKVAHET